MANCYTRIFDAGWQHGSRAFFQKGLSTRIKDAGIAIRHSRGGILFYTAGSRNGFEGMDSVCPGTQNQVDPVKKAFFVINPHQRCGYSDSQFARIYIIISILQGPEMSWKWVVALWDNKLTLRKKHFSVIEKIYSGRQTGWKRRPGSCEIDNEAHLSCKRRVTANVVQNDQI